MPVVFIPKRTPSLDASVALRVENFIGVYLSPENVIFIFNAHSGRGAIPEPGESHYRHVFYDGDEYTCEGVFVPPSDTLRQFIMDALQTQNGVRYLQTHDRIADAVVEELGAA
jgi:hypothetical protein